MVLCKVLNIREGRGAKCMSTTKDEIADSNSNYMEIEIAKQNVARLQFISLFSIQLLFVIISINIYSHYFAKVDYNDFKIYLPSYIFALFAHVLLLFVTQHFKHKQNFTIENARQFQKILITYIWSILITSCFISTLDHTLYKHIVIYLVYLLSCTAFLVITLKKILPPVLISTAVLCWAIIVDDSFHSYGQGNLMLLLTLTEIILILGYFNGRVLRSNLLQHQELLGERNRSKDLTEALQTAAHTDELTNLANRRGYLHRMQSIDQKLPIQMTVLIIDIDFFKKYNDFYGHAYGDVVLAKVATTLHSLCTQPNRFAVRWGGEEFLILLENHSEQEIHEFYNDFITAIEKYDIQHATSNVSEHLTFSVGGNTQFITDFEEMNSCILHADEAQYMVKRSRKDGFLLMEEGDVIYMSDIIMQTQLRNLLASKSF